MTPGFLHAALLAPALLLFGASVMPEAAMKCGPQPPGQKPVVAIDGVIIDVEPDSIMKRVDKDDIERIEIVCMNPVDSTFHRGGTGIGVVSLWTKDGPVAQMRPMLSAILEAQDAHFHKKSAYLTAVEDIKLPYRSAALRMSLEVKDRGWIAKATVQRAFLTCYVFAGDVPAPLPSLVPRQPDCVNDP